MTFTASMDVLSSRRREAHLNSSTLLNVAHPIINTVVRIVTIVSQMSWQTCLPKGTTERLNKCIKMFPTCKSIHLGSIEKQEEMP